MTKPRHPYRPWKSCSQVNERRIPVSDPTSTQAVQGEDRVGIVNPGALLRHLSTVLGGSPGSWVEQSERKYASSGKPSGRAKR